MKDTQPYSEAKIEIDSIEFDKNGSITFIGTIEGQERVLTITSDDAAFDKFIPAMEEEFECREQDGLFCATLDDFNNLFWQIKVAGNIVERRVHLTLIIEEMLLEAYHKTL